ncbi:MAG: EAL domain-containing protein [Rhodocyclales bacterium GT-UBC]|nr:MAG: EAL domain-containing protein [Rhodocyclales bacterium GT-UBC]
MTVRAFEDHLTQSLNVISRTLATLDDDELDSGKLKQALRHTPYLRSISLLDAASTIIASSEPRNVGLRIPSQTYMPPLSGPAEVLRSGMLVDGRDFYDGQPVSASLTPTLSFIPVSLDIALNNQRWMHTVASINADYFLNFYSNHLPLPGSVVQLLRYDGSLLLDSMEKSSPASLLSNSEIARRISQSESGRFEEKLEDERVALTTYRSSRLYPFILVLRQDKEEILASWRQESIQTLAIVFSTLVTLLGLATLYFLRFQRMARAHEESQERLRIAAIAFDAQEGMVVTGPNAEVLQVNPAFTQITGFSPQDAVGRQLDFLKSDRHDAAFYQRLDQCVRENGTWTGELFCRHKDGSTRPLLATITAVRDHADAVSHYVGTLIDISERKAAEEELLTLSRALEQNPASIIITDPSGSIQYVNPRFETVTGYSLHEVIGQNPRLLSSGETSAADYKAMWTTISSGATWQGEFRNRRKDGTLFWEHASISPVFNDEGTLLHYVGIKEDISARKEAEQKLHLAASVFTHAREGILITSADGTIIDANDAFGRITGYQREEVLGQNPRILNSGRQEKSYYTEMWQSLHDVGYWYGEVWNRHKNGELYAVMQTISTIRDAQGNPSQYVALFSDITPLKEHERQLERIAHYDALTLLPNRVLLADRLHQAMAHAQRQNKTLAVAYLDLDGFKGVNDRHGHKAGDQLLVALSTRMRQALRDGDTLARLGGDEFVAVLLDLNDASGSVPMLSRLLAAAAQPVQVGDLVLQVSASIGVTFYPQSEDVDADQLLRQSDQAMYQAKVAGKNRYHVFDAELDRSVRGHHENQKRLRRALLDNEFVLHYQPKVNMRTGTLIGAEALIRWQHPEKGLLLPDVFLPTIEEHPLAIDLGEWVIDTALSQMQSWQAAGLDIPVSVNVGARQLQQPDFVERLTTLLAAHPDVPAHKLELEVLETSALEDLARASQVIEACREIGVKFALDDFGTGYSSLTYLKRLPVTRLKIDQSFVRGMLDDPDDLAILDGVIGLATAFRRNVIAEGVEAVEHGEMLLQLGCECAQGYGIARPMPVSEFPAWVASWRPPAAWQYCSSVSREDLQLLFVSVEHRAWVKAMHNFLRGDQRDPPTQNPHECRFGAWLEGDGFSRHGNHPAFPVIQRLHEEIHEQGAVLLQLYQHGKKQEAVQRLNEVDSRQAMLLQALKQLIDQASAAPQAATHLLA